MFGKKDKRLEEALEKIKRECGKTPVERVRPAVELLYKLTHNLPASEGHHHDYEGGLFEHSVDVAIKTYRNVEKYLKEVVILNEDGVIRSYETETLRSQYRIASFILGLVHDVGKIADYEPAPEDGFLIQKYFPLELKGLQGKPRRVKHRRDLSHHLISVLLLYEFLKTNEDFLRMDTEVYIKLTEALAVEHYPFSVTLMGENVLLKVLKESDAEDVAEYVEEKTAEKVAPPKEPGYVDFLRRRILKGMVKVNSRFFQVWIDGEKDYLIVNTNVGIDEACRELDVPDKVALINALKNLDLLAVAEPREILKVRFGERRAPCIVLKLHRFNLPEDFLKSLHKPPPYTFEGIETEEPVREVEV